LTSFGKLILEESNAETSYKALCAEQDAHLAELKRHLALQVYLEERAAGGPSIDLDAPFSSTSRSSSPCIKKARKMKPPSSSEEEEEEEEEELGAPGTHYKHIYNIIMV
jgi:hypothetical protein